MTDEEIISEHLTKSKKRGNETLTENRREKKFVNKILVDIKSGFDMPIDPLRGYEVMPSIYCEVGYLKQGGI